MKASVDSATSVKYLVFGLIILLGAITFSGFAAYNLEDAYWQRKMAVDNQRNYIEISTKLRDWALVSGAVGPSEEIFDHEIANTLRIELDLATEKLIEPEAQDQAQQSITARLTQQIADLKTINRSGALGLIRATDATLTELMKIENDRLNKHGMEVIGYIHKLNIASAIAFLISLSLFLFSIRAKRLDDQVKFEVIARLKNLKEEAEGANRVKSKFLSTVSHEIRTPLNGIIGISDLMIHSPSGPLDRNLAKIINNSGKALLRLINDILDLSKIEAGKLELIAKEFSIRELLNEVFFNLDCKAHEKGIHFDYEISKGIPKIIWADPERLAQVLYNLIGNAIKFTQFGSVHLSVAAKLISTRDVSIQFSIKDTGCGISTSDSKIIFNPFVQIKNMGTLGEPGTGLGLSICQSVVRAMNGELTVESDEGRGSEFSFTLPITKFSTEVFDKNVKFERTERVQLPKSLGRIDLSYKPIVLLAEDNPTNQVVAELMLQQLGLKVVTVSNGQSVLDSLESQQIDLILMDCQMPSIDGFEATKQIRQWNFDLPIIALTANAFASDEKLCLEVGMNDFIAKPVDFSNLKSKLLKNLPTERIFDLEALNKLDQTIGIENRKKVINSFLSTTPFFRETFQSAEMDLNLDQMNRLGHRFKGSAQVIGGINFSNLCDQLESAENIDFALSLKSQIFASLDCFEQRINHYS